MTTMLPHSLDPARAPTRIALVALAAIAVAEGLAPTGEMGPAARIGCIAALLFALVAFKAGWRQSWLATIVGPIIVGIIGGVPIVELERWLRPGPYHFRSDDVAIIDTIFGGIAGAWQALILIAAKKVRAESLFEGPDLLERVVGIVLVGAALFDALFVGFDERNTGFLVGAGLLLFVGVGFSLRSTQRLKRRRAWIASVRRGEIREWSMQPAAEGDESLMWVDRPPPLAIADSVLVYSGDSTSGAFRGGQRNTRVARILNQVGKSSGFDE
jgi:hypothetical protein